MGWVSQEGGRAQPGHVRGTNEYTCTAEVGRGGRYSGEEKYVGEIWGSGQVEKGV